MSPVSPPGAGPPLRLRRGLTIRQHADGKFVIVAPSGRNMTVHWTSDTGPFGLAAQKFGPQILTFTTVEDAAGYP